MEILIYLKKKKKKPDQDHPRNALTKLDECWDYKLFWNFFIFEQAPYFFQEK